MRAFVEKFCPTIVTDVPGAPLDGVIEIVGPAATIDPNGKVAAVRAKPTIAIVTIRSRPVVGVGNFGGGESGVQRLPSQNVNAWLHSSTRLTQ
jgi:hypothetical protein